MLRLCPTCSIVHLNYPRTSQVLAAIPFIAEFKLACDGGEVSTFLILIKERNYFILCLSGSTASHFRVNLVFHQTPALYADIDGVLMPVTKSAEGEKYQVGSRLSGSHVKSKTWWLLSQYSFVILYEYLGFLDPRSEEGINW